MMMYEQDSIQTPDFYANSARKQKDTKNTDPQHLNSINQSSLDQIYFFTPIIYATPNL